MGGSFSFFIILPIGIVIPLAAGDVFELVVVQMLHMVRMNIAARCPTQILLVFHALQIFP